MVDASVVVSIVIAVISLLSTIATAGFGYTQSKKLQEESSKLEELRKQNEEKRQEKKQLKALTETYSQPLRVAAYELAMRLYELLEFPISKQHLETKEGLDDIKIFTCYKFAQFMAWTHLLRSKTQYFSFSKDQHLEQITDIIIRLDEEFDRRRDDRGWNIGVWPGSRVLVSERMLKDATKEKEVPMDTILKGYNDFHEEWETQFKTPMGYFCQWIDDMVEGRRVRHNHWDDAMRNVQHNLCDMLDALNKTEDVKKFQYMKRCGKSEDCDCDARGCGAGDRQPGTLENRGKSRNNDSGLRPFYNEHELEENEKRWIIIDEEYDSSINLEPMLKMTCADIYRQGIRVPRDNEYWWSTAEGWKYKEQHDQERERKRSRSRDGSFSSG